MKETKRIPPANGHANVANLNYLVIVPDDAPIADVAEKLSDVARIRAVHDIFSSGVSEIQQDAACNVLAFSPENCTPEVHNSLCEALGTIGKAGNEQGKLTSVPGWDGVGPLPIPAHFEGDPGSFLAWLLWMPDARTGPKRQDPRRSAQGEDDDSEPIPLAEWPAPPDDAAYYGVIGEIVRTIEPETEADPLAVLVQLLIAFGNAVGRRPHVLVEATKHHANEFVVLVGQSSVARKGTSGDWARRIMEDVDPNWTESRIRSGLSSGEGFIYQVRDPVERDQIDKKTRKAERVMVDPGVSDKRLMVIETEFASALRVMERDGNRLSALLRLAWDTGNLVTLTKDPMHATGAHVSISGHITGHELRSLLSQTEAVNGFANRFLWLAVRRARVLPLGGKVPDLAGLTKGIKVAAQDAAEVDQVRLDGDAVDIWCAEYERLTASTPGVLGEVISRAAPHVLRLALIYALTDRSKAIHAPHLEAAIELWRAAEQGARYIFGDQLENRKAEAILAALREVAPNGLTRTEISSKVFNRNAKAAEIKAALSLLLSSRLIREVKDTSTGGAIACRYFAPHKRNEIDAIDERPPRTERLEDPTDEVSSSTSSNSSFVPRDSEIVEVEI